MRMKGMRRREFITLGLARLRGHFAARAQQGDSTRAPDESASVVAAFRQGLNEDGYLEGKNVDIQYRWVEGQFDRLPALAVDLARRQVAVSRGLSCQGIKLHDSHRLRHGLRSY